jgi:hypothetical protein
MPFTKKKAKKALNTARRTVQRVPASLRRKVGTKVLKAAVGKKKAKSVIAAGRKVRRTTGMKFL